MLAASRSDSGLEILPKSTYGPGELRIEPTTSLPWTTTLESDSVLHTEMVLAHWDPVPPPDPGMVAQVGQLMMMSSSSFLLFVAKNKHQSVYGLKMNQHVSISL